jgi:hypothetical protein
MSALLSNITKTRKISFYAWICLRMSAIRTFKKLIIEEAEAMSIDLTDVLDDIVGNPEENKIFIRECVEFYFIHHPKELKEEIKQWEEKLNEL